MKYQNLIIIGTSHISSDSIRKIEAAFEKYLPEIVAVELDRRRLFALVHDLKPKLSLSDAKKVGLKGYLFMIIGNWLQGKLGEHVGVTPGSDMKAALKLAKEHNSKLALIDQEIEITLKRFSKEFSWKERFRMIWDLVTAPFSKKERIDISRVPDKEIIRRLMNETKKRYPGIYKALVEERNIVMANNLSRLMESNPNSNILAVVGAGHAEEIIRIIRSTKHKLKSNIQ